MRRRDEEILSYAGLTKDEKKLIEAYTDHLGIDVRLLVYRLIKKELEEQSLLYKK